MNQFFEILKAGLMTSIQDQGRKNLAYYAIPMSGVMDPNAALIALLLLNKERNDPVIECTYIPPHIKFNADTEIAISGANFKWKINNKNISLNKVISIKKGDILKGGMAEKGMRGYIAFKGNLELNKEFNSYSTYTNARIGGFEGALLKKGDVIYWNEESDLFLEDHVIPIRKGPEYNFLTENGKIKLSAQLFKISADSNRMGIRLEGKKIESNKYQLENSVPVLPGFIQLPPSGFPIVLLEDGQTTGGYPRIAYVPKKYFPKLNQMPLGAEIKFKLIN